MRKVDFSNGRITQDIIMTSLPMLVAQVLSLLYSIVDRIYIGRIPGTGTAALGAVGLCFPVIMIVAAFTNMYGMGGAPLFAMELGRGEKKTAGQIMNTAFRLLVITSVIITAAGLLLSVPLLRLFGATDQVLPASLSYLRIYILGTFPLMISTGMNTYINAQGYATTGMLTVAIGAVANMLLDPLFIFVLNLGIPGAAIATVLSQVLSLLFVLRFLFSDRNEHPVSFPVHRFLFPKDDVPGKAGHFSGFLPYAGDIISLGTAPFIMQITNSLVQISCNQVLMHTGGALYVSVMTIISSIRSILDVPALAVTEGASPVISFNYGAGKREHVFKAIRVMMTICFPFTFIVWLLILIRPQIFFGIFSSDPALLGPTIRAMRLYFSAFIFQSFQYSGQTVFKALGKKKQAIFFSLLRKAVLVIPLTYLLPYVFGFGTDGVFLAEPVSNVIGGLACFTTMVIAMRRDPFGR
ncbi:MAG: MATE family efflux transporter [Lachnospiraceae bacterium]|nr:MATE family efflux transporter [Lachnospiraceae bacterium]